MCRNIIGNSTICKALLLEPLKLSVNTICTLVYLVLIKYRYVYVILCFICPLIQLLNKLIKDHHKSIILYMNKKKNSLKKKSLKNK